MAPSLAPRKSLLSGGLFYPDEECGDCRIYAEGLAEAARARGLELMLGTQVHRLRVENGSAVALETSQGDVEADRYVLSSGADAPLLTAKSGISLPIIPVKGYSFTLSRDQWPDAPTLPILDEAGKHGYMPLGEDQIRLTGYAEIAGYGTEPEERRKNAFMRSFTSLFPQLEACFAASREQPFCCLRPVTPSGLPILGPSRLERLHYNVGHGHLGWTLAHGTARIVADQIAGRAPGIPLDGCRPTRRQ